MDAKLESLLEFIKSEERVCPEPRWWHELWEMLPREGKPGSGPAPGLPLILGGWHYSNDLMKMIRILDHVEWAASQGVLAEVDAFLRGLPEEEWHHLGD